MGNIDGKEKLFYGWIIVAAATAIYFIMAGSLASFGVFVKPMTEAFGWSRAAIAMGFTLFLLCNGWFAVVSGNLSDRLGPQPVVAFGGLSLGVGLYLTSRIDNLWQFYFTYSVLGGVGFSCLYIPLVSTVSRWFSLKKGMALGIFYAGAGLGGLIFSPLIQSWIVTYSWRTAYFIMGILTAAIVIPLAFFIKRDPAQIGLRPFGENDSDNHTIQGNSPVQPERNYTVSQALRTKDLWINNIAVMLTFSAIIMAQINMVPHATDRGVTPSTAALALGIAAAFNAVGRLVMGTLSDRIGTKRAMVISVFIASASIFWLIGAKTSWMFFAFALPFGFAYGGCIPQTPKIISELFGTKNLGSIMGVNAIFTSLGPAFGPVIGAFIFDQTGSYALAFLLGGVFSLFGLGFYMLLKLPKR